MVTTVTAAALSFYNTELNRVGEVYKAQSINHCQLDNDQIVREKGVATLKPFNLGS